MRTGTRWLKPANIFRLFGFGLFIYLFLGFMVLPNWNTLTQIFNTTVKTVDPATGLETVRRDPWAVIRFFFAGNMGKYVLNSLKLGVFLAVTVNIVGISIVLLTE